MGQKLVPIMQQNTLMLSVNHPLRAMEGLARTIALPHEFAPQRFPSFPALERTAVVGFSAPETYAVGANQRRGMLVFRQAAYPLWGEVQADEVGYYAQWLGRTQTATTADVYYDFGETMYEHGAGYQVASTVQPGLSGYTAPVTGAAVLGVDSTAGPGVWIYAPKGSFVYFVGAWSTAAPQNATLKVLYERWTAPGELIGNYWADVVVLAGTTGAMSTNAAVTASEGCWLRVKSASVGASAAAVFPQSVYVTLLVSMNAATYAGSGTNQGVVTCGAASGQEYMMPLVYPKEFDNSKMPWYAARTTATSLLATNVTPVVDKAGTVLAGRMSPQVKSAWAVTINDIVNLHPAEKALLPLETGFYTFVPPSTDLASFWDYTLPAGGVNTDVIPVFRLDNDAMYNVVYYTSGSKDSTLALTLDWHLEFRTSSSLFQVGMSTMSLETLHVAQLTLAKAGFFFENTTHKGILGKVVSAAKMMAPLVAPMHPALGAGLKAAMLLSNLPKKGNKIKPTSASGSGLVTKAEVKQNVKSKGKKKAKK